MPAPSLPLRTFAAILVILAVAAALDRAVFTYVIWTDVYSEDWGRLLRVMGHLPTWLVAALALWLHDRGEKGRPPALRALLLAGSATLAGLAAEILKLLLRRERPLPHDGDWVFRAFTERPLSSGGLALPSSHAAVAFGAAAMLAYLFPRARWVWFGLAAGCGVTRLLARAHFLTDVVVSALVALGIAALLWRRFGVSPAAPARRRTRSGLAFRTVVPDE